MSQKLKAMKLTKIVFCLMLLGGGLVSCIREDFDGCYSSNRLLLSYKGDGAEEIFNDKICRVEMFVFDAENKCVNSSILPREQVESRTALLPTLAAGDYRIICVGNTHATHINNVDACDYCKMCFASEDYIAGEVVSGNDSLYYASTYYTVQPYNGRDDNHEQTIEFASSHYDVAIEVAGIPAVESRAGALPELQICGVTPMTDFENNVTGEATDYILETQYEPAGMLLTARANIMRHDNHEDVNVRLFAAGSKDLLAEVNMAEFLAANPIIDCSKHEVLIPIRIEFKSGEVTVTVPEWYVEEVKPEF